MTDLSRLTLAEAARRVEDGTISPVELASDFLERASTINRDLNCLLAIDDDLLTRARRSERELRRGHYRGALHGIPIVLKDNLLTKNLRTTGGSRVVDDWRSLAPEADAHVARRLQRAGALVAAKTNLYELAYGFPHPEFRTVNNPLAPGHTTGGSSNGSAAAVAARLCFAAIGTDTGGSIRVPAAFCGLAGIKPTLGRVGRSGLVPLSATLDYVGPLARTVEDAALVLDAISGRDTADPATSARKLEATAQALWDGVEGLRVGIVADPAPSESVSEAGDVLSALGAHVSPVDIAWFDEGQRIRTVITAVEAAEFHSPFLRQNPSGYSKTVRQRLQAGHFIPGSDYLRAQRARLDLIRRINLLFVRFDVLVMPTTLITPPPIEQWKRMLGNQSAPKDATLSAQITRYTSLWNVTGHPAIVVPFPAAADGVPPSLQVVAPHHADATAISVARTLEQDRRARLGKLDVAHQAAATK